MPVSIGKNSLARAAAAGTNRTVTEVTKSPGSFRQVAAASILPLKGKKLTAVPSAELTASVEKNGVIVPLLLVQTAAEELRVLDGEARLAAACAVGLSTVPAVVLEMTAAEANAARRELSRFVAAPSAPVTATEVTSVGQAMPDWLL